MAEFVFLSEKNRERYLRIVTPVGNLFARLGVHPNVLSLTGLILSAVAGIVYSTGAFFWAAWILVVAGICDTLDGQLAKQTGKGSQFGAFLDSSLDRFSEVFLFMGLAWYFSGGPSMLLHGNSPDTQGLQSPLTVLFIILAVTGSIMVSYTRARAEGLGVDCPVGWMQRPERIVLLIIGSLFGSIPVIGHFIMTLTILLLAVLSNFTALQRMAYVKKQLLNENQKQHRRSGKAGKDILSCPHCGETVEKYRNPFPTVDIIIRMEDDRIVLIKRKNPPYGWALPGGFVDYGESLESAAIREAEEETSLKVELLYQLGAYSDPSRDPRHHTISVVFVGKASGEPKAADDAKDVGVFDRNDLPEQLAFDHAKILKDYFER